MFFYSSIDIGSYTSVEAIVGASGNVNVPHLDVTEKTPLDRILQHHPPIHEAH